MQDKRHTHNRISVFVARYPFDVGSDYLPCARQKEIDRCSDENVKKSKYYVFKLLEIAFKSVYGVDLCDCNVTKNSCGKWTCELCKFSLSHCDDVVAVAVSDAPVGVDVERVNLSRFDDRLQRRIFTESEKKAADSMTDNKRRAYANRIWTVKEAEFKRNGATGFVVGKIDTTFAVSKTKMLAADNADYYLSVAFENDCDVSFVAIGNKMKFVE